MFLLSVFAPIKASCLHYLPFLCNVWGKIRRLRLFVYAAALIYVFCFGNDAKNWDQLCKRNYAEI